MTRLRLATLSGEHAQKLTAPFLCRLKSLVPLTLHEEYFIEALQLPAHAFDAGAHVYTEGDGDLPPWIVGAGWACRLRVLPDGRRQIVTFFLPGDTIRLGDVQHPAIQYTILAMTDLKLLNATRLADAVARIDDSIVNIVQASRVGFIWSQAQLLDHVLRLGRLTALERMAHLVLELHYRMEDAGLAQDGRFPLPLTQSQFGEALGLSLVHVNRTLQQLRREQLIELKPGRIAILDRERLELLCDFRKPAI
jgi:CRP-like cAMP-binding protein